MTEWSPDDLRQARTRRFLKSGRNGIRTRLFRDHDPAIQAGLLSAIPIVGEELPVFASFEGEHTFVLITTRVIASISAGVLRETAVGKIRSVTVDLAAMMSGRKTLQVWDELVLETFAGERSALRLEPGEPFVGVWNALGFIPGRRRRDHVLPHSSSSAE